MKFNLPRIIGALALMTVMQSFAVVIKAENTIYRLEIVNNEDKNIQLEDGIILNFDADGLHYNYKGEQFDFGIDSIAKLVYRKVELSNLENMAVNTCRMQLTDGRLCIYPQGEGLFSVIDTSGKVLVKRRLTDALVLDLREYAPGIYIAAFNSQSYKLTVK